MPLCNESVDKLNYILIKFWGDRETSQQACPKCTEKIINFITVFKVNTSSQSLRRNQSRVPDFITDYLKHTNIYESPSSFWKWSAYATISAIIRDKCFLKNGDSFLFPNLYTLIVAESSGHRKNRPIELSESLVLKIGGVKTISGRASVHAIMDEIARTETDKTTGKVIKSSSAIFYAPELSAGIVGDPEGMRILTDIYDFKMNTYKSRLRTGPCFNLERIVFSMFSGSNEDMLRGLFDIAVIKGGFLARTLLITPNEFRKSNSLLTVDHGILKESNKQMVSSLGACNEMHGEMVLEEDAISEYEGWYDPFRQSYKDKKESSGIIGRIHTHVLKIAMVIAVNELTLRITRAHIELAIAECLSLLPNYSIFTMSHSKSDITQAGGLIINDLLCATKYTMARKELIRKNWTNGLDNDMLDKVVGTLESAGMITQIQCKDGLYFQLTEAALKMLRGGAA